MGATAGTAAEVATRTAAARLYISSLFNRLQEVWGRLWRHLRAAAEFAARGSSSSGSKGSQRAGPAEGVRAPQEAVMLPEDQRMACDVAITLMTIPGDFHIVYTYLAALLNAPSTGLGVTRVILGAAGSLFILVSDAWFKYSCLRNCWTGTVPRDVLWTRQLVLSPWFKFFVEATVGAQYNTPRLILMVIASGLGLLEIPAGSFFIW